MRRVFRSAVLVAACLTTLTLVPRAGVAAGADYGPLKDGFQPFFTRIDKDGSTAWHRAAEAGLKERGFSPGQIAKFTRLILLPSTNGFEGDFTPGKAGIAKFGTQALPVVYNSETGVALPLDPKQFAAALPDCYAQDERSCTFKYSVTEEITVGEPTAKSPCLIPERTVRFCQAHGFVNRYTFHATLKGGNHVFEPSCGEQDRFNGCGADEVVFDDGAEQTKLAFTLDEADKKAPAPTTAAPPPAFPKISYHVDRNAAFTRRDGPKDLENWEPDMRLVKQVEAAEKKKSPNLAALQARMEKMRRAALIYCWPHDVYKPCDVE